MGGKLIGAQKSNAILFKPAHIYFTYLIKWLNLVQYIHNHIKTIVGGIYRVVCLAINHVLRELDSNVNTGENVNIVHNLKDM